MFCPALSSDKALEIWIHILRESFYAWFMETSSTTGTWYVKFLRKEKAKQPRSKLIGIWISICHFVYVTFLSCCLILFSFFRVFRMIQQSVCLPLHRSGTIVPCDSIMLCILSLFVSNFAFSVVYVVCYSFYFYFGLCSNAEYSSFVFIYVTCF